MKLRLFFLVLLIIIPAGYAKLIKVTENKEYYQDGNNYSVKTYDYLKYYNNSGKFIKINESLFFHNGIVKSNEYFYKANFSDKISLSTRNSNIASFWLERFGNSATSLGQYSVNGSVITYHTIPEFVDISYQYLPLWIKETITFYKVISYDDLTLSFAFRTNSNKFNLWKPYICTNRGLCEYLKYNITKDKFNVTIPFSKYRPEDYPLYADPILQPMISNFSGNITYDGFVNANILTAPVTYTRFDNPASTNYCGVTKYQVPSSVWQVQRFRFETDFPSVPSYALDVKVNIHLYLQLVGIRTTTQVYNLSTLHTGLTAGQQFTDDGDGTIYTSKTGITPASKFYIFNVSSSENDLKSGNLKGFGFKWPDEVTNSLQSQQWASRSNADTSKRPWVEINYTIDMCQPILGQNFIVNVTCEYNHTTINIPKNITIQDSGYIIIRNSTLNYTEVPFHIDIWPGGILDLLNKSIIEI